jgi:hypothetical protein
MTMMITYPAIPKAEPHEALHVCSGASKYASL